MFLHHGGAKHGHISFDFYTELYIFLTEVNHRIQILHQLWSSIGDCLSSIKLAISTIWRLQDDTDDLYATDLQETWRGDAYLSNNRVFEDFLQIPELIRPAIYEPGTQSDMSQIVGTVIQSRVYE